MMKIIAIALQIIAVAGGAYVGVTLSSGSPGRSQSAAEDERVAQKQKEKDIKDKYADNKSAKDNKHGGGHDGDTTGAESGFMKFSRQFVVPIVSQKNVSALVIMDINLELDPSTTEHAYAREPKVRDALLKTLLQLSNEGAFGSELLEEENLDEIRERLRTAAETVLGKDVIGVLILNVARQDV